jgi:hypothetical protein
MTAENGGSRHGRRQQPLIVDPTTYGEEEFCAVLIIV